MLEMGVLELFYRIGLGIVLGNVVGVVGVVALAGFRLWVGKNAEKR